MTTIGRDVVVFKHFTTVTPRKNIGCSRNNPLLPPGKNPSDAHGFHPGLLIRPVATRGIQGQWPPNCVLPINLCFKHIIRLKILPPLKYIFPPKPENLLTALLLVAGSPTSCSASNSRTRQTFPTGRTVCSKDRLEASVSSTTCCSRPMPSFLCTMSSLRTHSFDVVVVVCFFTPLRWLRTAIFLPLNSLCFYQ